MPDAVLQGAWNQQPVSFSCQAAPVPGQLRVAAVAEGSEPRGEGHSALRYHLGGEDGSRGKFLPWGAGGCFNA